MPKSLKVSSGERIDVVDFVQGANTYTQEAQKHLLERAWIDRRGRILDGFKVRIEDQSLNPGLITVYNGNSVDRSGQLINNEDFANDSRSVTLLGVSTTFYVEIEFTSVESDTDARFFWDPTVPNTPPIPDGSEFALNVATRISPDWKVLINTTGFQQSTNPNSLRVPVCILNTDVSNQVSTGANPGLTLVQPASVLESDIAIGATSLRIIDARVMPTAPFSITLDFGGALPENRIVTAVDRNNGILTLSVATASAHQAGSIVRAITGNVYLVADNRDPSSTSAHPDPAQRLWQANELRGSALIQSKETFGTRDDLNLRSLKDEIDFLSAQLREMKFGHPRPDVVSTAPPALFATRPRYFDRAGSIQGAKTNTVSIGNGTTTFGDFNGTDDTPFVNAINALPVTGGTIFVKGGTYNFAKPVTLGKPVRIVGVHANAVNLVNDFALGPLFYVSANCELEHISLSVGTGLDLTLDILSSVFVSLVDCIVAGTVRLNGAVAPSIRAYKCAFSAATVGTGIIASVSGATLTFSEFISCSFVNAVGWVLGTPCNGVHFSSCLMTSVATLVSGIVTDVITNLSFEQCDVTVASTMLFSTGAQTFSKVRVTDNKITSLNLSANQSVCLFSSAIGVSEFAFRNNYVSVSGVTGTTSAAPASIVSTVANTTIGDICIEGNYVTYPFPAVASANWSVLYVSDSVGTSDRNVVINNNRIYRSNGLVRLGSLSGNSAGGHYVIQNNCHVSDGATAGTIGVEFFTSGGGLPPVLRNVEISKNSFLKYTSALAGSKIGVLCTFGFNAAGTSVTIKDNYFSDFSGGAAPSRTAAIDFGTIATATVGTVKVSGNKIFGMYSNGADCFGINLAPANLVHSIEFEVCGNTVADLGGSTALNVSGIYMGFVASANVSNNTVTRLSTANATSYAACIALDNCGLTPNEATGFLVTNNRLSQAQAAAAAASPYYGMNLYAFGGVANLRVNSNVMSQRGLTSGAQINVCVRSDSVYNLNIDSNLVASADLAVVNGIYLTYASGSLSASAQNVSICSNIVDLWASNSWTAITTILGINGAVFSKNINISGNTVIERVNANNHTAIRAQGNYSTAVCVSNNMLSGLKTGGLTTARVGILLSECLRSSVSHNIVDWLEALVAEGSGIEIIGASTIIPVNTVSVVGNVINSDGNPATYEIYIDTTTAVDGTVQSNIVGNSFQAGVIFPMPAVANWQYGVNMTNINYGTNKFN